jgi:response regulator RpfG family c-di-GMP phosphodiesterase
MREDSRRQKREEAAPTDEFGLPSSRDTSIYIVDDDDSVVESLVGFLVRLGYDAHGFTDPIKARSAIRRRPPHLLIADRNMPDLAGMDLARVALEEDPDIGVVILTGVRDVELAIQAFRLGVSDYLLKPLDFRAMEESVRRVLVRRTREIFHRQTEARMRKEMEERTTQLEEQASLLEGVTVSTLSALVRMLEARTPDFQGHSQAVADLSGRMAAELSLPPSEVEACRTAGFLHDIGMIAVPDAILEKTGPLTAAEAARVKDHCRIGREILEPFPQLGAVPEYVHLHHERLDGSGYPNGLREGEIPLGAQIVAVADSFRALVEHRPFRPSHSPAEALKILIGTAGIWHSPEILKTLARVLQNASH